MQAPTPQQALKQYFGYDAFRLSQQGVIERTLAGQSSLVIMPTGGGKSMCYQLPSILLPGLTIVVSPLIALMQDQVQALNATGISAAAMNSSCTPEEESAMRAQAQNGELKLLYVSPERAVTGSFIGWARTLEIAQIAIDEAHCVSVWGNDFRPEYTQLTALTGQFPQVPVVALTATADAATQQDILARLALQQAEVFVSSFERKNIRVDVLPAKNRFGFMRDFIGGHGNEAGIVYCLSRKSTEQVAQKLRDQGYRAQHYHGAMDSEDRARIQQDFLEDKVQIICATIAFGMGIDKPNIRWIIHYNLPKNIESYYQEIGRAGRDGEQADALLFAGYGDMKTLTQFIDGSHADERFKEVQRAKLSRMWDYSQTLSCRTNFILNYFGEHREEGCGHCDRCLHPPKSFDGTIIAQKALSAVYRLKQSVGINLLIDVLRGASNRQVMESGYHEIKTYGAGKDIDWKSWQHYILQLIDRGYLAIDFTRDNALHLTQLSGNVLKGESEVTLCEPQDPELTKRETPVTGDVSEADMPLFIALVKCRSDIAERDSIKHHLIFSDATLKDMAHKKPGNEGALLSVHGVGEFKKEQYGEAFLELIASLVPEEQRLLLEAPAPSSKKTRPSDFVMGAIGDTHRATQSLIQQGMSVAEIAQERGLSRSTIEAHFLRLHFHGESVDLSDIITEDAIATIQQLWHDKGEPEQIRTLYYEADKQFNYEQIRYAVCLAKREIAAV